MAAMVLLAAAPKGVPKGRRLHASQERQNPRPGDFRFANFVCGWRRAFRLLCFAAALSVIFRTLIYSMGGCYSAFWQLRRKEFRKAEGCMQARKGKIPDPGISDLLISCAVGDVHSGYFVSPPLGLYFLEY
jgi:hypothetical protein